MSSLDPSRSQAPSLSRRAHVEAWERSGLSGVAYAALHGLKASSLYGWRRHRRAPDSGVPLAPPRLVPITVETHGGCEVVLADGRRLRFPETLPAGTLRAFLAAMERA